MSKSPSLSLSSKTRQGGVIDVLLIALLAIVALVVAGYFLFGQSFMSGTPIQLPFATPSTSQDITSLEKEIDTTEFDSIDSELSNLEKELDASFTE